MSEYSKKTVAELQEILKSRSLPHTGKKADLISRLQEADKASATPPAPAPAATKSTTGTSTTANGAGSGAAAEDEIDWDDDAGGNNSNTTTITAATTGTETAGKATTEAGEKLIAAGGKGQVPNPQAVPNQAAAIDPASTADLSVKKKMKKGEQNEKSEDAAATADGGDDAKTNDAEGGEEPPPRAASSSLASTKDFSQGLKATDVDEELEKRKKRAAKFGIALAEDDKEAQARLERAKRFGGVHEDGGAVRGLDQALPERSRKRGRGDDDESGVAGVGGRSGKRRDFGGRGRRFRRGGRGGGGGGQRSGNNADGTTPNFALSEKDRLAAEARKKRFAAMA